MRWPWLRDGNSAGLWAVGEHRGKDRAGYAGGRVRDRAVVGTRRPAALVELVVRQSVLIDQRQGLAAEQQAVIARLEARIREVERALARRERDAPPAKSPG